MGWADTPEGVHSLAQVFSKLLTWEVLGQLWDLRGCGQSAPVFCSLSEPSRPLPPSLTESHELLPEEHHQATELSSSCPHRIPAPSLQTVPLTVSNLRANWRRQIQSGARSRPCYSLPPLRRMHSRHFHIQRGLHPNHWTPRPLMF